MPEEPILDKDVVIKKEMSNGDSSNTEEDISFKIEVDMSSAFIKSKDTTEPTSIPIKETTESTKDGVSKVSEVEDI